MPDLRNHQTRKHTKNLPCVADQLIACRTPYTFASTHENFRCKIDWLLACVLQKKILTIVC